MNTDVKMVLFFGALMAVMAAVSIWKATPIGTKSVLVGVHQFLIHPLLLAIGWYIAYGFSRVEIGSRPYHSVETDDEITIYAKAVYAHLLHPALWVAFFVHDLGYMGKPNMDGREGEAHPELGARIMQRLFGDPWGDFCLLHSRYYAKKKGRPVSPLCFADKWVIVIEPAWLYIPRAWFSGDTSTEYELLNSGKPLTWHRGVRTYMRRWIDNHVGGNVDTWTKARHVEAA